MAPGKHVTITVTYPALITLPDTRSASLNFNTDNRDNTGSQSYGKLALACVVVTERTIITFS